MSQISDDLSGKMESSLLGNHQAITVNTQSKEIVLSLPAPNVFLNLKRTIKELPGAWVEARSNGKGANFVDLHYPMYLLTETFDNFSFKKGLRNGENIPGIPGGQLNVINVNLDKEYNCDIYFGEGKVAMLLNVPYDPMEKASIAIKKKAQAKTDDPLGHVVMVPRNGQSSGGILVSLVVPQNTLELLKQE